MKDIVTYLKFTDKSTNQQADEIRRLTGVDLNLDSVESHYRKRGTGALKAFNEFTNHWDSPECQDLIEPKACITFLPTGNFMGHLQGLRLTTLNREFRDCLERSPMTALLTWTLGEPIERHVSDLCSGKNPLVGLLADVAASLLLNEIHHHLRTLIAEETSSQFRLNPVAEHYPGIGSQESSLIPPVFELSGADRVLDIGLNDHMMIRPKKSQCSVVLLGDEPEPPELTDTACMPCQGKKCLYYQLGGCHVPEGVSAS